MWQHQRLVLLLLLLGYRHPATPPGQWRRAGALAPPQPRPAPAAYGQCTTTSEPHTVPAAAAAAEAAWQAGGAAAVGSRLPRALLPRSRPTCSAAAKRSGTPSPLRLPQAATVPAPAAVPHWVWQA